MPALIGPSSGHEWWQLVIRLLAAVALGGLVGWNRERRDKPAGLRTHILVALGSATFLLLGLEIEAQLSPGGGPGIDPTRVLQGVVGGIGFLGAGSILKSRGHITGVTTAASIWVSGALGAAAGLGAFVLAGSAALLTFLTLAVLGKLERRIRPAKPPTPQPSADAPSDSDESDNAIL